MKTSITGPRGPFLKPAGLAAVILLVAACGGSASGPLAQTGGQSADEGARSRDLFSFNDAAGAATAAPAPAFDGGATGTNTGSAAQAPSNLLVIKTGWLALQVESVEAAVSTAAARIEALDGYVSGSEQTGEGDYVTATVTYRVPADRWAKALEALRSLAVKVVSERTGTEDVTGQVVDLRARIANLKVTETALQEIMTRATKIADVLAVQAELTKVRGEIEAATAQRQYLEQQAALSTLTVQFGQQPEPAVLVSQKKFDPGSEVDRATASLVEVLQGLATAGIWFGIVWLPILVVVGFLALVAGFVLRRRRRRAGSDGPGSFGDPNLPAVPAPSAGPAPTEPDVPPAQG